MNKTIILTDTHFGCRQNSIPWLNSQLKFIYDQLIPYIKQLKKQGHNVRLLHLGDVFDSRSSVSTMVASKVINIFKDIRHEVDELIIIAGNHDYYSPNSDEINTLDILLSNLNINLVTKDVCRIGDDLFVPWYKWGDENIQLLIDSGVKNIFTHADIVTEPIPYYNCNVFSGHLHIPFINEEKGIYNIGSCYALNFADSNKDRGFYVSDENGILFIPNDQSIRFWRLYNNDIFKQDLTDKISKGDYVEIYVNQSYMSINKYMDKINTLTKKYDNIWIIPCNETSIGGDLEKFEGYNIEHVIDMMIPPELKDKYDMVLEMANSVNNTKNNIIIIDS